MAITSLILMATEGLLDNSALQIALDSGVGSSQEEYEAQAIVDDYATTVGIVDGAVGTGTGEVTLATANDFITRLDTTAPYISNRATGSLPRPGPTDPPSLTNEPLNYTAVLDQHIGNLFPPGDITNNQVFVQYALISMGVMQLSNKYVDSAVNGQSLASQTFINQDALMSGNLTAISTDIHAWGEELCNSGNLFNFAKVDNIGTPHAIIESLMQANMLGSISDELTVQGLDADTLTKTIIENPDLTLTPIVQKRCYDTLRLVTGEKLTDILEAMQFVTSGITLLADLLDLRKVFPTTFDTITAPDGAGNVKKIYTSAGNITDHFSGVTAPLTSVIPNELAIGNYVFTCSLSQIKGIRNTTPYALSAVAQAIEDNTGLTKTSEAEPALPSGTATSIKDAMGGGSGPNGRFYLADFVGAPAGMPQNDGYALFNAIMSIIETDTGFDDIAKALEVIRDVIQHTNISGGVSHIDDGGPGPYHITIAPGYPGVGTYSNGSAYNYNAAVTAILPDLDTAVANYIAAYPTEHAELLEAQNGMINNVVGAIIQLWDAGIKFNTTLVPGYETKDLVNEPSKTFNNPNVNGLVATKSSTLAFAENLHIYGKNTDANNIAEIMEVMAVPDTLGGDAVIASMREGRNLASIMDAGILSDNVIPT